MAASIHKKLDQLRNTRDLRAEILTMAAQLAASPQARGLITAIEPLISDATLQAEWSRLLPAILPEIQERMSFMVDRDETPTSSKTARNAIEPDSVALDKPNYRFEVLRLLLGASLERDGPQREEGIAAHIEGKQLGLVRSLGVSITPVRGALTTLRDGGLIRTLRWLEVDPASLSMEQLSRLGALPQTLRFRYERGARVKPPSDLVKRVLPLLGPNGPPSWEPFALSGAPVAVKESPTIDLIGTPRLDLIAHISRDERTFDASLLRLLDDGLELEPNMLAPAPVVVTLVRAGTHFVRDVGILHARCAYECDIFLSLLDMGLREQAIQYAKAVRA